ncbi:unnamed protein product, partial [Closterium sp. NIES-53]
RRIVKRVPRFNPAAAFPRAARQSRRLLSPLCASIPPSIPPPPFPSPPLRITTPVPPTPPQRFPAAEDAAVASTQRRNNARSADHPFPIPPPPSPHPQIAPPSVPSLSAAAGNRIEICIVSSAAAGKQIRIESFPCCGDRGTIATSQEAPRDSMMLGGVGLQQQESSCASRRNAAAIPRNHTWRKPSLPSSHLPLSPFPPPHLSSPLSSALPSPTLPRLAVSKRTRFYRSAAGEEESTSSPRHPSPFPRSPDSLSLVSYAPRMTRTVLLRHALRLRREKSFPPSPSPSSLSTPFSLPPSPGVRGAAGTRAASGHEAVGRLLNLNSASFPRPTRRATPYPPHLLPSPFPSPSPIMGTQEDAVLLRVGTKQWGALQRSGRDAPPLSPPSPSPNPTPPRFHLPHSTPIGRRGVAAPCAEGGHEAVGRAGEERAGRRSVAAPCAASGHEAVGGAGEERAGRSPTTLLLVYPHRPQPLPTFPLPQEDAVLLRHALRVGTKQWGALEKRGRLPLRDNKACCNRFIFLK